MVVHGVNEETIAEAEKKEMRVLVLMTINVICKGRGAESLLVSSSSMQDVRNNGIYERV
jgi:hypothetical protein